MHWCTQPSNDNCVINNPLRRPKKVSSDWKELHWYLVCVDNDDLHQRNMEAINKNSRFPQTLITSWCKVYVHCKFTYLYHHSGQNHKRVSYVIFQKRGKFQVVPRGRVNYNNTSKFLSRRIHNRLNQRNNCYRLIQNSSSSLFFFCLKYEYCDYRNCCFPLGLRSWTFLLREESYSVPHSVHLLKILIYYLVAKTPCIG